MFSSDAIAQAVRTAAPHAPEEAVGALAAIDLDAALGLEDREARPARRLAALIGQAAHESAEFRHTVENLNYSASGLIATWPHRFSCDRDAAALARRPEAIANRVYADRMGNGPEPSGDGWRYRGRGYLMLTGRANYRLAGDMIGEDLEGRPDLARDPFIAWRVAADFLRTRRMGGRTAFEWADDGDTDAVSRIVNGGRHGLADRLEKTGRAYAALRAFITPDLAAEPMTVAAVQAALVSAGFDPGPIDGLDGPRTRGALRQFQTAVGLEASGEAGGDVWAALRLYRGAAV